MMWIFVVVSVLAAIAVVSVGNAVVRLVLLLHLHMRGQGTVLQVSFDFYERQTLGLPDVLLRHGNSK